MAHNSRGRILMHYEMRGFARYTVELFRAMKEIAGGNVDRYSFSPGPIAPEFLSELEIKPVVLITAQLVRVDINMFRLPEPGSRTAG